MLICEEISQTQYLKWKRAAEIIKQFNKLSNICDKFLINTKDAALFFVIIITFFIVAN